MEQSLEETVLLLARTPDVLDTLLRGMPETWTLRNEGEATWSPFDIVAHLINAERENWIPRARVILNHGESRPFPPDREKLWRQPREDDRSCWMSSPRPARRACANWAN